MMTRNKEQSTTLSRHPPGAPTVWNPFEEMTTLRREMDDLFARGFGYTPLSQLLPSNAFNFEPPFEIKNLDDKVQIFLGVPGFKAEEIQVVATDYSVQITGERKALTEETRIEGEKSWLSGESRFSIAFTLPGEVDPNKSKATVYDGILTLEIPKTEQAKMKSVKVAISQK